MAGMFGDEGDRLERLALLPHPRGMLASEGRGSVMSPGIQWGDWIAPQWLAALSQAAQAPRAAYEGADVDPRDALNVALNTMGGGMLTGRGASGAGMNVFHGTQRTKKWYDDPALMEAFKQGKDIEPNTYPVNALKGGLGGLKMMDGLGPHVGTAEAANQRLTSYHGIPPSRAWKKDDPRLHEAYVMKFEMEPAKPLLKKNGQPMTEVELQSYLARRAEALGHSRDATRRYSSSAPDSGLRAAQKAVRDDLRAQGYDAIPYINSHEARGSTSWVVLDPTLLKNWWEK